MQFIISDCHGCFHTLVKLIDRIRHVDPEAQFVFVGDYVDRGLYSKEVVDFVIDLQKTGAVCLRGNHDDVIDWILNKHSLTDLSEVCSSTDDITVCVWWLYNGFSPTIASYGVKPSCDFQERMNQFRKAVPDAHKEFFKTLPFVWENETHFACHAYLCPNEVQSNPLVISDTRRTETLWERFPKDVQYADRPSTREALKPIEIKWDKIGVFGHTPVSYYGAVAPIKHSKLRLIDTGVFEGNYLCGYNCDLDDHMLQATDSRDLPQITKEERA